jgi:hypothetical protein
MDLIQKEYGMFRYKMGEKLCSHIARFLDVTNRLGQDGVKLSNKEQIKKLLDSLSQDWSLQCMMVKQDMLTANSTSGDLINTLKVFEMDLCKRGMSYLSVGGPSSTTNNVALAAPISNETNQALEAFAGTVPSGSVPVMSTPNVASQPSGSTTQCCNIASQMSTKHMTLSGMFLYSYEALIASDLKGKSLSIEDMVPIDPDDMEDMDL